MRNVYLLHSVIRACCFLLAVTVLQAGGAEPKRFAIATLAIYGENQPKYLETTLRNHEAYATARGYDHIVVTRARALAAFRGNCAHVYSNRATPCANQVRDLVRPDTRKHLGWQKFPMVLQALDTYE